MQGEQQKHEVAAFALPLSAGKLFKALRRRRTGQRVIVTQTGDIIVRPQPLELRLQLRLPGEAACACAALRQSQTNAAMHLPCGAAHLHHCAFVMGPCKRHSWRNVHVGCSQAQAADCSAGNRPAA